MLQIEFAAFPIVQWWISVANINDKADQLAELVVKELETTSMAITTVEFVFVKTGMGVIRTTVNERAAL